MTTPDNSLEQEITDILEPVIDIVRLQIARGYPYTGPNILEQLVKLIKARERAARIAEVKKFEPPVAYISDFLIAEHEYRGKKYAACNFCGFCPDAFRAYIDERLTTLKEQQENDLTKPNHRRSK